MESVAAELEGFEARLTGIAGSAVAASALVLAAKMDDESNSATSVSLCAKALREAMESLEARLPPPRSSDKVDDIGLQREKRRAAARAAGAAS